MEKKTPTSPPPPLPPRRENNRKTSTRYRSERQRQKRIRLVVHKFSKNQAIFLLLRGFLRIENGPYGLIKHGLETLLRQRRTFEIFYGGNLLCHLQRLRIGNWREFLLFQLFNRFLVVAQVQFRSDENNWRIGTVMTHFRVPLGGGGGGGGGGEIIELQS